MARRVIPTRSRPRAAAAEAAASPARRAALNMLVQSQQAKGPGMDFYLDEARRRGEISAQDAGLAQEIAYGVSRRRRWLEKVLAEYLHHPLPKQAAHVHNALLAGVYQALYLDRVPPHTVVDETVRLVGAVRTEASYRGLANAVMRRIVKESRESLLPGPEIPWLMRLSIPDWLASEGGQIYRDGELVEFFEACNTPAPLNLRAVYRDGAPDLPVLEERLRGEIVDMIHQVPELERGRYLHDCFIIRGRGIAPEFLSSFRRGYITAEDEGGQIVGHLAGARPGMRILDFCASPGGKTAHLSDIAERRAEEFVASDVSEQKLDRLRETLLRLGLADKVETTLSENLTSESHGGRFDLVLVDAPCSGLGTLRRHPEIRWRRTPKGLRALATIQGDLLERAAPLVRPGGHLVFSLCTFTQIETDLNVKRFLHNHPEFEPALAPEGLPFNEAEFSAGRGKWRTAPHRHGCDAFFVARFVRK